MTASRLALLAAFCSLASFLSSGPALAYGEQFQRNLREVAWRVSFEEIPIVDDTMGVLGVHVDSHPIKAAPNLYLGVGGYGGLTGEEGGFFTLGGTLGYRQPLGQRWALDTGLHVGGGGGSSLTFPGGGLILRPHAALEWRHNDLSLRAGVAHTSFPNSTNPDHDDTHAFIGLRSHGLSWAPGAATDFRAYDGPHYPVRITPSALYYLTDDDRPLLRDRPQYEGNLYTGAGENKNIPLLGAKIEQFVSPRSFRGVEFYGAGGGGADGFAAFLFSLGHIIPLGRVLEWENKAVAGMAGDGRLDTGGGLVLQLETGLNLALGRHWYLKTGVGYVRAPDGEFGAKVVDLGIGWRAARPLPTRQRGALFAKSDYRTIPWDAIFSNKTYLPDDAARNKSGNEYDSALHLIGLTLSRPLNDWFSLQTNTHWAYEGNIGSYAEGMVGFSLHPALDTAKRWRALLDANVGVAGGGVMDVDGGVIQQLTVGLQRRLQKNLSLALSGGMMRSRSGSFEAGVLMLQLSWHHDSLILTDD